LRWIKLARDRHPKEEIMISSEENMSAIAELDLDPIKVKLMHEESGEGWSLEKANSVEVEYRRFLILMKLFPQEQTAPLFDVDTFWHYHILDTMKYAADCERVFGYFLHHFPYIGLRGEDDEKAHHRVGERMRELYEATFGDTYGAALQGTAFSGAGTVTACSGAGAQKVAFSGAGAQKVAFSGAGAQKMAFSGAGVQKVAFSGAGAQKVAFSGAGVQKVAFSGAGVQKVAFSGAGVQKVAFSGAGVQKVAFSGAGAQKMAFSGAGVPKTAFSGAGSVSDFYSVRPSLPETNI
jgi:predicted secreted protein